MAMRYFQMCDSGWFRVKVLRPKKTANTIPPRKISGNLNQRANIHYRISIRTHLSVMKGNFANLTNRVCILTRPFFTQGNLESITITGRQVGEILQGFARYQFFQHCVSRVDFAKARGQLFFKYHYLEITPRAGNAILILKKNNKIRNLINKFSASSRQPPAFSRQPSDTHSRGIRAAFRNISLFPLK